MKKNLVVLIVILTLATLMYIVSGFLKTDKIACTLEAKICPDGSTVGRSGPKCEFAPCPTLLPTRSNPNKMCGGIAGALCPEGYICSKKGNYPDAAGTCIKILPIQKPTK
ncbi:MAG: hypothetical protein WCT22_04555 [Patescibacteria group bacterium]|jgi:hypothetical protein